MHINVIIFLICSQLFGYLTIGGAETLLLTKRNATHHRFPKEHVIKKIPRLLLVTGCGRSGTGYMTEFLRASGLDLLHEHMGNDGSVSWLMASEIDWAPWGPLSKEYKFKHIFHQVRNPLKVIQSFYNVPPRATWEWICAVVPQIKLTDSDLIKCSKYWYYWNLMAEARAEWTYRIEDFDTAYIEMGKRLGRDLNENVLKSLPKNTNTKGPPVRVITWAILKDELDNDTFEKVQSLAQLYGYNTTDEP